MFSRGFKVECFLKLIYTLSLHSTNAHLVVPCSSHVRQNKRGMYQERINTTICINYDIIYLQYNKDVHE